MKTNTFKICNPKGKLTKTVEFTPMIYKCGDVSHRFALHLDVDVTNTLPDDMKDWVISDPLSGKRVRTVCANCKGLVIASRGFKPVAARNAAIETLDFLIKKIGADKFNAVIAAGQVKP